MGKVELKTRSRKIKKMKEILWDGSAHVGKCLSNVFGKIKVSKIISLWDIRNVS